MRCPPLTDQARQLQLRAVPLFANLPAAAGEDLARQALHQRHTKEPVVIYEGRARPLRRVFGLARGQPARRAGTRSGREHLRQGRCHEQFDPQTLHTRIASTYLHHHRLLQASQSGDIPRPATPGPLPQQSLPATRRPLIAAFDRRTSATRCWRRCSSSGPGLTFHGRCGRASSFLMKNLLAATRPSPAGPYDRAVHSPTS